MTYLNFELAAGLGRSEPISWFCGILWGFSVGMGWVCGLKRSLDMFDRQELIELAPLTTMHERSTSRGQNMERQARAKYATHD